MLGSDYGDFAAVYRPTGPLAMIGQSSTQPRRQQESMPSCGPQRVNRSIVLIGLMGAGKSCIGRRLASRLNLPFTAADAEIEAAAGCTIEEIFARHGEVAFRNGERRVIQRLLAQPPQVLAAGGGAFMDPRTREAIRNRAVSVWLRADLDLLLKRTARRNNRPLLKRGNPREILDGLMDERYPVYAEADVVVDSVDAPPAVTVERVYRAVSSVLDDAEAAPPSQGEAER
jgi:shikimate kinase